MRLIAKTFFFLSFFSLAIFVGSGVAFARTINMYDTPQSDAKIVGSIDLAKGVNVIFSPEGSDYIKVADPSNGNVGWVKQSDIRQSDKVIFTHNIVNDGTSNGSNTYEVQYGSDQTTPNYSQQFSPPQSMKMPSILPPGKQLSKEQMDQIKALQQQTQQIQNYMSNTVNNMVGMFFQLGQPNQKKNAGNGSTPNIMTKQPDAATVNRLINGTPNTTNTNLNTTPTITPATLTPPSQMNANQPSGIPPTKNP